MIIHTHYNSNVCIFNNAHGGSLRDAVRTLHPCQLHSQFVEPELNVRHSQQQRNCPVYSLQYHDTGVYMLCTNFTSGAAQNGGAVKVCST